MSNQIPPYDKLMQALGDENHAFYFWLQDMQVKINDPVGYTEYGRLNNVAVVGERINKIMDLIHHLAGFNVADPIRKDKP